MNWKRDISAYRSGRRYLSLVALSSVLVTTRLLQRSPFSDSLNQVKAPFTVIIIASASRARDDRCCK